MVAGKARVDNAQVQLIIFSISLCRPLVCELDGAVGVRLSGLCLFGVAQSLLFLALPRATRVLDAFTIKRLRPEVFVVAVIWAGCTIAVEVRNSRHQLHFLSCACHPCAGAMLVFSASFPF